MNRLLALIIPLFIVAALNGAESATPISAPVMAPDSAAEIAPAAPAMVPMVAPACLPVSRQTVREERHAGQEMPGDEEYPRRGTSGGSSKEE